MIIDFLCTKSQTDSRTRRRRVGGSLVKPFPAYRVEAHKLHIEGEVSLEVMFAASGNIHIEPVVRGLGDGLHEAAQRAAEQIRFQPAKRNGQPYDSNATVRIVFELAQ